jgi:uncharacterized damage-inducible protein DinB
MIQSIRDFQQAWAQESEGTLRVLRALTDDSLSQSVTAQDRSLGRIAWHIVQSIPEMMCRTGLQVDGPPEDAPVPPAARLIAEAYDKTARGLLQQVVERWTDASLEVEDDMYGFKWKRSVTLSVVIHHQIHHRGQMTVLMRQANLRVPGVYGPAREEWAAMGMHEPLI